MKKYALIGLNNRLVIKSTQIVGDAESSSRWHANSGEGSTGKTCRQYLNIGDINMFVSDLLNDIQKRDLVLPEFQREYVWDRDQAKQLMVSLIRGYPVGGLLFWKTD
jgi:hypothetical protein